MTLDEINEQIAKLMQEKAEDQALAHYVAPRASSRFDYIMNGDRSGLDKFDASEQAYATMLAKQRMANDEAYKQILFNELSKEADRLNALKIAKQNKSNELDTKKDEYIRGRNKAVAILNYAQQALVRDPNNNQLQKEVQIAKEDFDFYDRKLGGQGYDNIKVPTVGQSKGLDNNQVDNIVKAIVDRKSYTNDDRNRLLAFRDYVNDLALKEQIDTILSKKGATKEDNDAVKATRESFAKNWKPGQPFDNKIYKQKFKNGKPYLVVR